MVCVSNFTFIRYWEICFEVSISFSNRFEEIRVMSWLKSCNMLVFPIRLVWPRLFQSLERLSGNIRNTVAVTVGVYASYCKCIDPHARVHLQYPMSDSTGWDDEWPGIIQEVICRGLEAPRTCEPVPAIALPADAYFSLRHGCNAWSLWPSAMGGLHAQTGGCARV